MINFSEINSDTQRDTLINRVSRVSGLPKKQVINLYENFSFQPGADFKSINESFENFLNPKKGFDTNAFQEQLLKYASTISTLELSAEERYSITSDLIMFVEKSLEDADIISVMEVVCFVLMMKNSNFINISENFVFAQKFLPLFESETLKVFDDSKISSKENVRLYESLKNLLAKNNNRWGNNYHLDNTYNAIMEYIYKETNDIINQENITSISDTNHMAIINDLLYSKNVNPLYLSVAGLRTLVPDLQTFVFDLMLLINNYIQNNSYQLDYVNRNNVIDYVDITNKVYSMISTSVANSKLIKQAQSEDFEYEALTLLSNFQLKLEVTTSYYKYRMHAKTIVIMLGMINQCGNDFNLKIRNGLNRYVTKTLELVIKIEKIQINNLDK